jgi:hypothetical protein
MTTAIHDLLARGILAAADPFNVSPTFDSEIGMCLAIRIGLDGTVLLVPRGGDFFVNDTLGPVFTDAHELWATAAHTWNEHHAEPKAADTLRSVRRLAGEDPMPGAPTAVHCYASHEPQPTRRCPWADRDCTCCEKCEQRRARCGSVQP